MNHPGLQTAMAHCGLIAILRGITPAEAESIGLERTYLYRKLKFHGIGIDDNRQR